GMTGNVGDDRKLARVTVDVGWFREAKRLSRRESRATIDELLESCESLCLSERYRIRYWCIFDSVVFVPVPQWRWWRRGPRERWGDSQVCEQLVRPRSARPP